MIWTLSHHLLELIKLCDYLVALFPDIKHLIDQFTGFFEIVKGQTERKIFLQAVRLQSTLHVAHKLLHSLEQYTLLSHLSGLLDADFSVDLSPEESSGSWFLSTSTESTVCLKCNGNNTPQNNS